MARLTNDVKKAERRIHELLSWKNPGRDGQQRFLQYDGKYDPPIVPPSWKRLEDESSKSWTQRSKGEQERFIESYKKLYSRTDGETKKKTLERLDQGFLILKNMFAVFATETDSEDQPSEWNMFLAFAQACYEEYAQLAESIFGSAEFQQALDHPYTPADHGAVLALGRLKATAVHGDKNGINRRLAEAWAHDDHQSIFRHLQPNETYPSWEQRENELKSPGYTIEGGLHDLESCFYTLNSLPEKLDSSFKDGEAELFSAGYRDVSIVCSYAIGRYTN